MYISSTHTKKRVLAPIKNPQELRILGVEKAMQLLNEIHRVLTEEGISFNRLLCLGLIAKKEGRKMTLTDVSKSRGFSTAAATAMVDGLEKQGLVKRVYPRRGSSADRRKVWVTLSPKGVEVLAKIEHLSNELVGSGC